MPETELTEERAKERDALIAEIVEVFAGVTREGGISWGEATAKSRAHEAWMEENVRKPPELFKGRDITWREFTRSPEGEDPAAADTPRTEHQYDDKDRRWEDLVPDPEWDTMPEHGGFSYLDPIGRRYYLPAAMMRSLQDPRGFLLSYELTVNDHIEGVMKAMPNEDWRSDFLERWSALSDRHRIAVKHFVQFKVALEQDREEEMVRDMPEELVPKIREALHTYDHPWHRAYASYWQTIKESP